uniref:Uncharacterized protein n=1 Tax=Kalanchoe fedtschenkoi TaxID=63787 RepID=A0A7N0UEN8_KALFE
MIVDWLANGIWMQIACGRNCTHRQGVEEADLVVVPKKVYEADPVAMVKEAESMEEKAIGLAWQRGRCSLEGDRLGVEKAKAKPAKEEGYRLGACHCTYGSHLLWGWFKV